jgi:short-subunit dehydrogenase
MTPAPASRPLALLTGGTSGIGRALAHGFAARGFDLLLAADEPPPPALAKALAAAGARVEAVVADLRRAEEVERLWRCFEALGRPLDALALNAGVGAGGRFAEIPLADDLAVVDLNVRATVQLAKRGVARMVAQGAGRLLVTSSIAADMPGPFQATYDASKAFGLSFALALREELRDSGVTVTALLPGPTDTPFFARNAMDDTRLAHGRKDDPDDVAADALDGLLAGRAAVVSASLLSRLQHAGATLLPDALVARLVAHMAEPGGGR